MDATKIVQNVKKYCKIKGVKPTPACRDSGVGTSFINDIERGKVPSVEKVQMLAAYLEVTTSELLGEKITFGEGDENDPVYRELRYIIDNATSQEQRKFLDLIKIYKGYDDEAAEGRKKKDSPARGEAVQKQKKSIECGTPVEPGSYKCSGCGKTIQVIHEAGETIPVCGLCNSNYFFKIT